MTTDLKDVTLTREGRVGLVSFSRPPNNHFDIDLIGKIGEAFADADADAAIGAIVLASEGKTFCAGASFGGGGGLGGEPAELYRAANRLFRTVKPVVIAVQGAAIGGGLGLALVGDFRVVAPEARFSANFVKLGIHPGFGLTHTLPRLIGNQAAALLFYSGRRIDGAEALRIGLADDLAPLDQLRERTIALAAEIAENAPLAVAATRATLRAGFADVIAERAEHESARQMELFKTADFEEGIRAVAEKRPGRWVGA